MAFAALGLGILVHAFCCRSDKPLFTAGFFRNYRLLLSILLVAAVLVLITVVPFAASLMGFTALSLRNWILLAVLMLIQLVVWEYPKIYTMVKF